MYRNVNKSTDKNILQKVCRCNFSHVYTFKRKFVICINASVRACSSCVTREGREQFISIYYFKQFYKEASKYSIAKKKKRKENKQIFIQLNERASHFVKIGLL